MPLQITHRYVTVLLAAMGTLTLFGMSPALGQESDWYPSRWGADDQRGAANLLTPDKVMEATRLIATGEVYQLGRVYEAGIPVFGTRHYSLKIPYALGPLGENQTIGHDAIISGELGQVGTQFDGLGHIGVGDLFYNGLSRHDFATPDGLTKLGVENVGPIVTRGVLIDVAAYKGVEILERRLRDHTRRPHGGARPAERVDHRRRRCSHPYRMGGALDGRQRSVQRVRARYRPRGG